MHLLKNLFTVEQFSEIRNQLNNSGQKLVFTNGCFDLLHSGHIQLLEQAKQLGDKLIIGLNSDKSIRALKGSNRPILDQIERATILLALKAVDYTIIFYEDTPLKIIQSIRPDFLVKGADWKEGEIVGEDFVSSYGGSVIRISLKEGYSTTGIIERIQRLSQ